MPAEIKPVQLSVRLWPGPDQDLIAWFLSLDGLPHGHKTRRIKQTLRQGIEAEDALYRTIKDAIEEALAQQGAPSSSTHAEQKR